MSISNAPNARYAFDVEEGRAMTIRIMRGLSPSARMARLWLLSAVLVGLLPIIFSVVYDFDHRETVDLHEILAGGDALVLAAALSGGCVYDLMNKVVLDQNEDTKKVLVVLAFVLGMGAAVWFVDIRNAGASNAASISLYTLWYLGGTIVVCLKGLLLRDIRGLS